MPGCYNTGFPDVEFMLGSGWETPYFTIKAETDIIIMGNAVSGIYY